MVTGIAIGVISTIVAGVILMIIENNTPLTKSKINVLINNPPTPPEILEVKHKKNETQLLSRVKVLVKNKGFKSGHIDKISIAPNDLRVIPKIKILEFSRSEIKPFRKQMVDVKFIIYISHENREELGYYLELYNEQGVYVGGVKGYMDPVKKNSPGLVKRNAST